MKTASAVGGSTNPPNTDLPTPRGMLPSRIANAGADRLSMLPRPHREHDAN